MWFHSFKAKIALFSVCTSGVVLIAFASVLLGMVRHAATVRLERALRGNAERAMRIFTAPGALTMPRGDETIRHRLQEMPAPTYPMRVMRGEETVFQSQNWPSAVLEKSLLRVLRDEGLDGNERFMPPPPLGEEGPAFSPRKTKEPNKLRLPKRKPGPRPPSIERMEIDGHPWMVMALFHREWTIISALDCSESRAELYWIYLTILLGVFLGLAILAAGGWMLAKLALRPVHVLTHVAESVTSRNLDARISLVGADKEFQQLIDQMNGLLARLEASFSQASRFSADAAHELKTPLAVIQGTIEQALKQAPADSAEQRLCVAVSDEILRLKSIVNKLLLLAQSDAGRLPISPVLFALNDEIEQLGEDVPMLAPQVTLEIADAERVEIQADRALIRQVLQNLFSNAIKYNAEKGWIACQLTREDQQAVVRISNAVDPQQHIDPARLFERFYRGDPAHSRKVDGCGLGLSLSREIARAHGGDLAIESVSETQITFCLRVPLTSQA